MWGCVPGTEVSRRPHEEAGGGLLGDGSLVAVQAHRELIRRRLGLADDDLLAGHQALVVEPMQKLAVVLRQSDYRRRRARLDLGERRQVAVLLLLHLRVDRPAVWAPRGMTELLVDAGDHVVVERVAHLV